MSQADACFFINGDNDVAVREGHAKAWNERQMKRACKAARSLIDMGAESGVFDFGDALTAASALRDEQAEQACFEAIEGFVAKLEPLGFSRAQAISMLWDGCEAAR
jgi:hypothetical protein